MLTASVIIPTYHRPRELRDCVRSILDQARRPEEIVVVDDGDLDAPPLVEEAEALGIRYIFHKKDKPGVCASRNIAATLSACDILFFLDDDVVLFPDYLARIMDVYEADPNARIGGVGGWVANPPPLTWAHRLSRPFDILFLNTGFREGRVLPSGHCTDFGTTGRPPREIAEVDFLPGGVCSYRRFVFDEVRFSEAYAGAGMRGEDKDFSFRVSRRWPLLIQPAAQLYHYEAPSMRVDKYRKGYQRVVGTYRLFRDHVRKGALSWFFYYYALFGYTLKRLVWAMFSLNRGEIHRVKGILAASLHILTGKVK